MSDTNDILRGMSNPYYNPDDLGLEIAFEVSASNACYSFHMFVVWRDADDPGRMYFASDAGCSCPSPFEDFRSVDDLTPVTSAQQLHDALDETAYSSDWGRLLDGSYGRLETKSLNSDWTELDVAEGHRKISELKLPTTVVGGYVIRGEIAA